MQSLGQQTANLGSSDGTFRPQPKVSIELPTLAVFMAPLNLSWLFVNKLHSVIFGYCKKWHFENLEPCVHGMDIDVIFFKVFTLLIIISGACILKHMPLTLFSRYSISPIFDYAPVSQNTWLCYLYQVIIVPNIRSWACVIENIAIVSCCVYQFYFKSFLYKTKIQTW